jgi:hypothetical protein
VNRRSLKNIDASDLVLLTWDSHGEIHHIDAVRGAAWLARNRFAEAGKSAVTVLLVKIEWSSKKKHFNVSMQSIQIPLNFQNLKSHGLMATETTAFEVGVRASGLLAGAISTAVFFGKLVVRENMHRHYSRRPVLQFNGVQVGDLIASEYLAKRESHKPISHKPIVGAPVSAIRRRRDLARVVFRARLNYAKSLKVAQLFASSPTVVFATEWTYTHEILSRVCEQKYGISSIYRNSTGFFLANSSLCKIETTELFARQAGILPRGGRSPKCSNTVSADSTKKDLTANHNRKSFGGGADTRKSGQLAGGRGSSMPTVVVFLHDVRDAQFEYGVDGYRDIRHWAESTIQRLSQRGDVTVWAKPHPNSAKEGEDGPNRNFVEKLIERYSHVTWVPTEWTLDDIIESCPEISVVTHHGTVGIEAAMRGRIALASRLSMYSEYKIAKFWKSRAEYERQLSYMKFPLLPTDEKELGREIREFIDDLGQTGGLTLTFHLLAKYVGVTVPEAPHSPGIMEAFSETNARLAEGSWVEAAAYCLSHDFSQRRW